MVEEHPAVRPAGNDAAHAPLLRAEAISRRFGGVQALRDVSFDVDAGEIVGLIGPNGSGKSTCVNLLSGTIAPTGGRVLMSGAALGGARIERAVGHGIVRTFQATQVFAEFTALDNVLVGCHILYRSGPAAAALRSAGSRREEGELRAHALDCLAFVGIADRAQSVAGSMSAAEQRLLMIAVALAARPKVLLLDEPAAGMVAAERRALADVIRAMPARGTAVLLIEHHMGLIMQVCDRIVVLNFGQKIAEGTPAEIRANEAVVEAYLGTRHDDA
ncbi:MAG: ABC transporter ATP-binding protein [Burkholderiaceae bacterium]|nr:ABC transporter ATP-binding protein [Burkholderiaceae bacterium]MEB2317382.1 ABC transporter ATP-binding protein [Pseudomonadota bacterium]